MLDLDVIHQTAIKLLQQMVGTCDANEATRRQVRRGVEVLGHLFVRSLICSHRSIVSLLRTTRFTCFTALTHSLT